ncbi:MAG: cyclic nucleotide-binding domain-containing protein [Blastocatellales bacterium]
MAAIESIGAIADLTAKHDGHYDYELDLEVIVYGRNYNGKKVGPYVRLLTYMPGEEIVREGEWGGNSFYIVVSGKADVLFDNGQTKVAEIPAGVQFGEMSVLAGVPRSATIRAPKDASVQVLEVERPALRLLRKLPKFGEVLDSTYRRNGRATTIQDIATATQLSKEAVSQLEAISQFKVFGKNHVLFRSGDRMTNLFVLKSGWAKVTPRNVTRQLTPAENHPRNWNAKAAEAYFGPSHCFGVEAITRDGNWEQTCTLMGRAEVLEISLSQLRKHPELREILLLAFTGMAAPDDPNECRQPLPVAKAQETLIETGLVDGTNLLLMDMDLCVRCGNCSMACHQMHGQSRLLRRGVHVNRPVQLEKKSSFQSLLSPSVCMHCQDPECLTGCPTGAIGRFPGGQVDIEASKCIGCGDCATQCPYNAITMVPRKGDVAGTSGGLKNWFDLKPPPLPPPVEQTEDLLAVKCNLCQGTTLNPPGVKRKAYSCEENCPTGALLRVDPHIYFAEIKEAEGTIFRDSNQVVARHTSHKDFGKQLMHGIGLVTTLLLTLLTIAGLSRYGLERPLIGSWLDMRWLTGIVGLVGIVGVMAYPVRRQIYRKRAGALRYWMLSHSYLGVIAGILILLHGGTSSGGALTTTLMISFDLVILTGLFGILIYFLAPRMLTRIEGQPLLIEDLTARREELNTELGEMMAKASANVRTTIQQRVIPRTLSLSFLLRQYLKRESLEEMIETAKKEFAVIGQGMTDGERARLMKATEIAATMRRVDSLIYLHQLLKLWLAPHVLFTSLMLALMIVHIIQVLYFLAR